MSNQKVFTSPISII